MKPLLRLIPSGKDSQHVARILEVSDLGKIFDANGVFRFVTHDVDEAVTLADRIFVMGRNPGRIRRELRVPLPRPRRRDDVRFLSLAHALYKSLGG